MTIKPHQEVVMHLPEVDPSRRRWFIASVVVTSVLVLAGWGYFLIGQVGNLTEAVPQTFAADFFPQVVAGVKEAGSETASNYKQTIAPLASDALTLLKARLQAQETVVSAVAIMAGELQARTQ